MKWVDKEALIVKVDGLYAGIWRHAWWGGWCRYDGDAYSTGESAPPELQKQLNEFAKL